MKTTAILITLAIVAGLCPAVWAEDAATPEQKLIATHADSIVSIKYVQKTQIPMMGADEESSGEARGILLSKDGLVLTSSSPFEGGLMGQVMRVMGQEIEVKTSVSDLKILFGTEEKEYEAQLVAKDSNLGLAFLKIRKLDDRELKPLDFSQSTTVGVGDDIRTLGRMPRGFDCAPMVVRAYVKAAVERPREMWALNLDGGDLLGMPAFNKAGTLVGFLSLQKGAEGAETESGGMMGMLGAAQNLGAFLIPAQALKPLVAAAIKAAKELQARAAEEAAEEEEDQEEGDEEEDEGSLDGEEE